MFANILYFLIALIIYTTTGLFETKTIMENHAMVNAVLISMAFIFVCKLSFDRLARKIDHLSAEYIDHWVGIYINRLSIFALVVFAVNLYGFKIYTVFSGVGFFDQIPTIEAIVFLSVFLFYLTVIWWSAYKIQKTFFPGNLSRRQFIFSNVAFSLPALLPWFVISIVSDMLIFLPWQPVKDFMDSPAGEFGYIAFFLVAIAVLGPVFIKTIWRCKPLAPGYARSRIEAVCQKTGLKHADILLWELFGGGMITAGVMGLVGRFRYILVTPGLLRSLNEQELDAVILHEIGHVQKHHMLFYLLFFAGFVACNFVLFEPLLFVLYVFEPVYRIFEMMGISKANAHPVLFSSILIFSFVVYFRFGFGFFMRNFERQADLHVYRYGQDASSLISTFYKIASYSHQSMEKPNWHHFNIGQRIRFLKQCQEFPDLIRVHHRKVAMMMAGFVFTVLVVFSLGYSINYGSAKPAFEQYIAQKILFQELAVDPDNADLYVLVGDYYHERESYQKAIDAYENVLKVAPDNVHALNNLAWLYATCKDENFRNHEKALVYAKQAVALQREDFVLDTLAEALFVNKDIHSAVLAAREALDLAKDKKTYYQEQLERFQQQITN